MFYHTHKYRIALAEQVGITAEQANRCLLDPTKWCYSNTMKIDETFDPVQVGTLRIMAILM